MKKRHPMQPLEIAPGNVLRFKQNAIVRFLLDHAQQTGMSLNKLVIMPFKTSDWDQFHQLTGYSVSGFCELSHVSEAAKDRAYKAADKFYKEQGEK